MQNIENNVIWVTGSSRGIGLEIAKALSSAGKSKIAICGRSVIDVSDLITHFGFENVKNDNIKYYQVDFEIPEQIFSIYEKIKNDFGKINVLVNNTGLGLFKPFRESTLHDYDKIMNTNTKSTFITSQLVIKDFIEANKGMIVNILSIASEKTFKNASIYAASKSAIKAMMNVVREETRKFNIDIVNIYPGATATEIWDSEYLEEYKYRMMDAEEVAQITKDVILNCINSKATIEDVIIRPKMGDL
ncbi:MAG: SDR family NAD(P)-dependent oxidoreductase [Candidatus Kapabacteria bacterium]|nr:SDR family NAD(P)-dependent oxidoreductase [Candidatus Kapabacteria bacterium]